MHREKNGDDDTEYGESYIQTLRRGSVTQIYKVLLLH